MKRQWLVLGLLIGLSIVLGIVLGWLFKQSQCQSTPSTLLETHNLVLADSRVPCIEFYWRPEITDEFHVLVKMNNFGLHAPVYSVEKPANTFRVLVVGDSFPQGIQVKLEETFPYLLQQQLGQIDGRQVEVINLSVDSIGTDRELLMYAYLGWQFQPDLVLLSVYPGNDIQDNQIDLEALRYSYRLNRPFFTLNDGALKLHNSVQLAPDLFPDSAVFQWLSGVQVAQLPSPQEDLPARPKVIDRQPYTLEYPVEWGIYLPEDKYWKDAWALTEALLLQFRDEVRLSGVPFVTVIIPDRRAVHDTDWTLLLTEYGKILPDLYQADPTAPGSRLERFLTGHSIPTLNLTTTLHDWAQAHSDTRLYYPYDGHFTPDGHAVTAQAITAWLQDNRLLHIP